MLTRRALPLVAGGLIAACRSPAGETPGRIVERPVETPVRFGPVRLHLVVGQEGLPALDNAVRNAIEQEARRLGYETEITTVAAFTAPDRAAPAAAGAGEPGPDAATGSRIGRRLLETVQAGVAPDGLLLLGRQAQTARLHAMGTLQEVSGLMRAARTRHGATPEVAEHAHIIAGNWYAAPLYQRLIGHWVRTDLLREAGLDSPAAAATFVTLRESLHQVSLLPVTGVPPGIRPDLPRAPWGIGPADTGDADSWCWNAIHAWGGVLADAKGERVALDSPQTAAALTWLAATYGELPWRAMAPPQGSSWNDTQKNDAFTSGASAYTFTERLLGPEGAGDARLIAAPAGPAGSPAARTPRAVGGGAVWVLPRGAAADPVERLWEALLAPETQRRLWTAAQGAALPAYERGWSDSALGTLAHAASAARFREQLTRGGFISHAGQLGPETAAAQAIDAGRLAARLLRAVLAGRPVADVIYDAHHAAAAILRAHGLPG